MRYTQTQHTYKPVDHSLTPHDLGQLPGEVVVCPFFALGRGGLHLPPDTHDEGILDN